ncbi:MAG: hypothetical protein IT310_06715 [Anaerolineales bacterium]|nr:hypothetical protein [Anaerolineales bacterium]
MTRNSTLTVTRLNFDKNEFLDFQYIRALCYETYGGASVGEVVYIANEIKRRGGTRRDYIDVWTEQGQHVAVLATDALARGQRLTARTYFLRAYNYLRAAEFYFYRHQPVEHRKIYLESVSNFDQAGKLFDIPVEKIEIPYEHGITMPGYFLKPAQDSTPRATVIISGGGDGHGEELYFIAGVPDALSRGLNVLLFHGPGQRGLLHRHPELVFRHDAEIPFGAVIDYALSRPDVDGERLALYGLSFGGYLTPRVAAYDKRIRALIANAPIPNFRDFLLSGVSEIGPNFFHALAGRLANKLSGNQWNILVDCLRASDWVWDATIDNQMLWTSGAQTFGDFLEWAKSYTLEGLEKKITCPTLCMTSEGEGPSSAKYVRQFYATLQAPKRLITLAVSDGSDSHCGISNLAHTSMLVYDWLLEVFAP